jgi:hypothetical protein
MIPFRLRDNYMKKVLSVGIIILLVKKNEGKKTKSKKQYKTPTTSYDHSYHH